MFCILDRIMAVAFCYRSRDLDMADAAQLVQYGKSSPFKASRDTMVWNPPNFGGEERLHVGGVAGC